MVKAHAFARGWVVVYVWRGIPTEVHFYRRFADAHKRERSLRHSLPEEDEVGLFEINSGQRRPKRRRPTGS
jgi:hypothetical protein